MNTLHNRHIQGIRAFREPISHSLNSWIFRNKVSEILLPYVHFMRFI